MYFVRATLQPSLKGGAENAGPENAGPPVNTANR